MVFLLDFAGYQLTLRTIHLRPPGPEWPSGEPGEFPVGHSAPLMSWAGRLACFFFFLHTQNNVYVFKLLCD